MTGLLVGCVIGQAQLGEPWEEVEWLKAEKENLLDTYLQYKEACFDLKDQLDNMTTKLYSLQARAQDAEANLSDLKEKITELSHNQGVLVKELIGYNVTLNYSLPKVPEEAPVLRVHKIPVNQSMAVEIATNVFGYKEIDDALAQGRH